MKDVMLDLETLGTRHDAMIVQIGACYFDRITGDIGATFSVDIDPGQHTDKFTVDYSTIKWWMEQSDSARKSIFAHPIALELALSKLQNFLWNPGDVKVWSHATFDMPILANAYHMLNMKFPIPFRDTRDLRTLMDLAALDKLKRERFGIHHNALDDAKFQASYASDAFVKLNGKS